MSSFESSFSNLLSLRVNAGPEILCNHYPVLLYRYTAQVKSYTSTGPTSATIIIGNLSEGWLNDPDFTMPDLQVNLDWSNPANFTAVIPTQTVEPNDFYSYGPARVEDIGGGTFSSCDNTLTLRYRFLVSAGSFGNITSTLAR